MDRLSRSANHNKYVIDNGLPFGHGGRVTGLVHPVNLEEAEFEQERLGVVGTLKTRNEFEKSARHINIVLGDQRGRAKISVQAETAKRLGVADFAIVQALVDLGVVLAPDKEAIITKSNEKQKWADLASKEDLESFDPSQDWD
jgi:beta-lactamase class D